MYKRQVYIYSELMPTPALSFAVRELGCSSGINVTASHNPAEYNGYKVYNEQGCQITGEVADSITAKIEQIDIFTGVKPVSYTHLDKFCTDNDFQYGFSSRALRFTIVRKTF